MSKVVVMDGQWSLLNGQSAAVSGAWHVQRLRSLTAQ
jgi:hypothetical protein